MPAGGMGPPGGQGDDAATRRRIEELLLAHHPEKLEMLLQQYEGRLGTLLAGLEKRYGAAAAPPPQGDDPPQADPPPQPQAEAAPDAQPLSAIEADVVKVLVESGGKTPAQALQQSRKLLQAEKFQGPQGNAALMEALVRRYTGAAAEGAHHRHHHHPRHQHQPHHHRRNPDTASVAFPPAEGEGDFEALCRRVLEEHHPSKVASLPQLLALPQHQGDARRLYATLLRHYEVRTEAAATPPGSAPPTTETPPLGQPHTANPPQPEAEVDAEDVAPPAGPVAAEEVEEEGVAGGGEWEARCLALLQRHQPHKAGMLPQLLDMPRYRGKPEALHAALVEKYAGQGQQEGVAEAEPGVGEAPADTTTAHTKEEAESSSSGSGGEGGGGGGFAFAAGDAVVVCGLQRRADLNGLPGEVLRTKRAPGGEAAYVVSIAGHGEPTLLQGNLEAAAAPAAPPPQAGLCPGDHVTVKDLVKLGTLNGTHGVVVREQVMPNGERCLVVAVDAQGEKLLRPANLRRTTPGDYETLEESARQAIAAEEETAAADIAASHRDAASQHELRRREAEERHRTQMLAWEMQHLALADDEEELRAAAVAEEASATQGLRHAAAALRAQHGAYAAALRSLLEAEADSRAGCLEEEEAGRTHLSQTQQGAAALLISRLSAAKELRWLGREEELKRDQLVQGECDAHSALFSNEAAQRDGLRRWQDSQRTAAALSLGRLSTREGDERAYLVSQEQVARTPLRTSLALHRDSAAGRAAIALEEDAAHTALQQHLADTRPAPQRASSLPPSYSKLTLDETLRTDRSDAGSTGSRGVEGTLRDHIADLYIRKAPGLPRSEAEAQAGVMMQQYEGREEDLVEALEEKYGQLDVPDYAESLRQVYAQHDPSKMPAVQSILSAYTGREEDLFSALALRYKDETIADIPKLTRIELNAKSPLSTLRRKAAGGTAAERFSTASADSTSEDPASMRQRYLKRLHRLAESHPHVVSDDVNSLLDRYEGFEKELVEGLERRCSDPTEDSDDAAAPAYVPPARYKERLVRFFHEHTPDKLDTVDSCLRTYRGREEALFDMLIAAYGEEPPATEVLEEEEEEEEEGGFQHHGAFPTPGYSHYSDNSSSELVQGMTVPRGDMQAPPRRGRGSSSSATSSGGDDVLSSDTTPSSAAAAPGGPAAAAPPPPSGGGGFPPLPSSASTPAATPEGYAAGTPPRHPEDSAAFLRQQLLTPGTQPSVPATPGARSSTVDPEDSESAASPTPSELTLFNRLMGLSDEFHERPRDLLAAIRRRKRSATAPPAGHHRDAEARSPSPRFRAPDPAAAAAAAADPLGARGCPAGSGSSGAHASLLLLGDRVEAAAAAPQACPRCKATQRRVEGTPGGQSQQRCARCSLRLGEGAVQGGEGAASPLRHSRIPKQPPMRPANLVAADYLSGSWMWYRHHPTVSAGPRSWKRAWFTLRSGTTLVRRTGRRDGKGLCTNLSRALRVCNHDIGREVLPKTRCQHFVFSLTLDGLVGGRWYSQLLFCAESMEMKREWMSGLRAAISAMETHPSVTATPHSRVHYDMQDTARSMSPQRPYEQGIRRTNLFYQPEGEPRWGSIHAHIEGGYFCVEARPSSDAAPYPSPSAQDSMTHFPLAWLSSADWCRVAQLLPPQDHGVAQVGLRLQFQRRAVFLACPQRGALQDLRCAIRKGMGGAESPLSAQPHPPVFSTPCKRDRQGLPACFAPPRPGGVMHGVNTGTWESATLTLVRREAEERRFLLQQEAERYAVARKGPPLWESRLLHGEAEVRRGVAAEEAAAVRALQGRLRRGVAGPRREPGAVDPALFRGLDSCPAARVRSPAGYSADPYEGVDEDWASSPAPLPVMPVLWGQQQQQQRGSVGGGGTNPGRAEGEEMEVEVEAGGVLGRGLSSRGMGGLGSAGQRSRSRSPPWEGGGGAVVTPPSRSPGRGGWCRSPSLNSIPVTGDEVETISV